MATVKSPVPTTEAQMSWSVPVDPALAEATAATLNYYDQKLRAEMERNHMGKIIAIHADNHEFVIGEKPGATLRALRTRFPEGYAVLHTIGPGDEGLARRMQGTHSAKL